MKKILHISTLLLAVILLLFFVACGSGDKSKSKNGKESKIEKVITNDDGSTDSKVEGPSILFLICTGVGIMGILFILFYYFNFWLWIYTNYVEKVKISLWEMFKVKMDGINIIHLIETLKTAKSSGLILTCRELVHLHHANIPFDKMIKPLIVANNAALGITMHDLMRHHLAGGNIEKVVTALVAAKNVDKGRDVEAEKLKLNFNTACSIDLAGIDIVKAVSEASNPKVIPTEEMTGFAKDGVELILKARVTLRLKIVKLLSGAKEDTILARIAEGMVTEIGKLEHDEILRSPYQLCENVLARADIFVDSMFEVLSIDVVHFKIGKNVLLELEEDRARTKLEVERAKEQEERARAQAARARVIEAEVDVQKAMAAAFLEGNFSIDDYKKMRNMDADTMMRESMSKNQSGNNDIKNPKDSD